MKTRQFVRTGLSIPKTIWTTLFDSELDKDAIGQSMEIENAIEFACAIQNVTANTQLELQILIKPHSSLAWQLFASGTFTRSTNPSGFTRYVGKQSTLTNIRFDQASSFSTINTDEVGFLAFNLNGIRSLQVQARVTTGSVGSTAFTTIWANSSTPDPGNRKYRETQFSYTATAVNNGSQPTAIEAFDCGFISIFLRNRGVSSAASVIQIPANTLTGQPTIQPGVTFWGRFAVQDASSGLFNSPWCWLRSIPVGWTTPNPIATTIYEQSTSILDWNLSALAQLNVGYFPQVGILCHCPGAGGAPIEVSASYNG